MAFHNSSFYQTDFSEYDSYNSSDYNSYYDSAQFEPQMTTPSAYEPSFSHLFDYPPPLYFAAPYDSVYSFSSNACCSSTFSAPTVIEYDPNYSADNYQKVSTEFVISYAVSEFNEPEFEEYDPTPYGGGYDINQTYGKPLTPSIEICYPRSSSSAVKPPLLKREEEAKERIEEKQEPSNGSKSTQIVEEEVDSASQETEGVSGPDLGSGYENGGVGEGEYDYERAVRQFPGGYGLEAMDLCETLFGYWPCLSRAKKQTGCGHENTREDCYGNPWQTAADYLFGSHYPYSQGHTRDGDVIYSYEKRYLEESLYGNDADAENCWVTEFDLV